MTDTLERLKKSIRDICVTLHTEFYSSKEDSDESMLELNELLNEEAEEMLAHISDAVSELINIKHQVALVPDIKENTVYQKALQKLEAEIRNRVTIEHQLKLHIEELNYRIEKFNRGEKLKRSSMDLDGLAPLETDEALTQTTDHLGKNETRKLTQEISKLRKVHKRDSQRILELEQKFRSTEEELKNVKDELEMKERDIVQKASDVKRTRLALTSRVKDHDEVFVNKLLKEINFYRSRFEGKCLEVSALEGKLQLLSDRLRSESKHRVDRQSSANSSSPVRVNKSLIRKRSDGGLSGTLTGTMTGTLSGTVKLKPHKNASMERSMSNERLRKAYREVCRSRASVVVTYKSNAK